MAAKSRLSIDRFFANSALGQHSQLKPSAVSVACGEVLPGKVFKVHPRALSGSRQL